MKSGIELIAEERKRQIEVEGWTLEHDAQHCAGEMAVAAACYAVSGIGMIEVVRKVVGIAEDGWAINTRNAWPWGKEWYKPCPDNRIRELVKAGAMIAAEIDRLFKTINISKDGDQFCATYKDFGCLQTSPAGFGNTPEEAIVELINYK